MPLLAACGATGTASYDSAPFDVPSPSGDASAPSDLDASFVSRDAALDANTQAACEPPDVMIVLDRSESMAKQANGTFPSTNDSAGRALTKWGQAVSVIESFTRAPRDGTMRFGLELFPRDPRDGTCLRVSDIIDGKQTSNPSCAPGEVVVPVGPSQGARIASFLSVNGTPLCGSTPTGAALEVARADLAVARDGKRKQYVVLITDGGETCGATAAGVLHRLAAERVETFVVGYNRFNLDAGASTGHRNLNDLACAGLRSPRAATDCVRPDGSAGFVAKDPAGPPLYLPAPSGAELDAVLTAIAGQVCCGCVK